MEERDMDGFFSGAHIHLLVNHVPILGALFALALLAASFIWAPDVLRRTALVVLIGTGVASAVADLTGEPAEDAVRGLPGVLREAIHAHEEFAEAAYIGAIALGVLALIAVVRWRRSSVPRSATLVALVGSVALAGAMAYTGLLGGRIRHTEVRPGATPTAAALVEPSRGRAQQETED
jgi:hypothetical protein